MNSLRFNFQKEKTKKINLFWGSVLGIFTIGILGFFVAMFGFLHLLNNVIEISTFAKRLLFIPAAIGIIIISITRRPPGQRTNIITSIFLFILNIAIWSFFSALIVDIIVSSAINDFDSKSLLFSALIPLIIMGICAALSFLNVFTVARLSVLISVLFIASIITFLVAFFVYRAYFWLLVIEVVLFSVVTIWNFKMFNTELQNFNLDDNSEILKKSIFYGLEFLISYFNLFIIMLRLISFTRD
ncbi:MAG0110 family membrane protein [Mycoplasmopsis cynos]|uniref:Inhibitor of apoptosis-promoting Bax1 n=2 Tax=Mycoplasmopsis cynos TaxID=171284 RepID=A0A449AJ17_9BACT|nr:hypothetical protein [Mycoplasmopsis cynos]UWV77841.1 hypothetical protein NW070_03040 [Mycoplasmopsis cynos]UWV81297.1 hypothetical protein NW065_05050 [Mycoplasmopsis cynos]UWV92546.1 hypothetical protein NWE57_00140 [Mycoplasmopsis cynos]WAM05047.1 hypothetical protein ONA01_02665 [Mycoplasmopsis cynos]WAM07506.1 hypothetical protein ONA21_05085 [Mycoplasmopsis cynos]